MGRYALQNLLSAKVEATRPIHGVPKKAYRQGIQRNCHTMVVPKLQVEASIVLTQMVQDFPTWEQYITRHMVLHIPSKSTAEGPHGHLPCGLISASGIGSISGAHKMCIQKRR